MKLQTIIGKRKEEIKDYDINEIKDFLVRKEGILFEVVDFTLNDYDWTTDENTITPNSNREPAHNEKGKYLYLRVSNLTNPQAFYQYLSKSGYTLIYSKLTQDCKISQDAERLNESYAETRARLKHKPMPQPAMPLLK